MAFKSTFTSLEQWREDDSFTLELLSPVNPLERGRAGLEEVLDVVESAPDELRPDRMRLIKRKMKYSRDMLWEKLPEAFMGGPHWASFSLWRLQQPNVYFHVAFFKGNENAHFSFELHAEPFSFWWKRKNPEAYAQSLLELVRAFASRFPITYGWSHSRTDFNVGDTPYSTDPTSPPGAYEAYWLNVYGARLVEQLGRARVLATPSAHCEQLADGSVLWLTRPTPADFDSEEARLAQARALVHLRPELKEQEVLATLRQRSRLFVPEPLRFHPDVEAILRQRVASCGLSERRQLVEEFNAYQPPPVTEWLPADQQPPSDMEDVQEAAHYLEMGLSAQFAAAARKEIPEVMERTPLSLAKVDYYLWRQRWVRTSSKERQEYMVRTLGAYLGCMLVRELGGRWVPRNALEQSAVLLGQRAWLPFLRVRHMLRDVQSALDCSLSQFFHEARRYKAQN